MRRQHINLRRFVDRFNQTKCFVHGFAGAVNPVHAPDDQAEFLHFFCSGFADGVGAAEHPRQNADAVREDDDAFGAHFPQRMGEFLFVEFMHIVHGERVRRVAVHHHAVGRIHRQARHMAH